MIIFREGNCLCDVLGATRATFEGFTFASPAAGMCLQKGTCLVERDLLARVVPDIGALLIACRKAISYASRHESVWGSAKENTPGKKAGRMVTFSSFVLSMAISTFGL